MKRLFLRIDNLCDSMRMGSPRLIDLRCSVLFQCPKHHCCGRPLATPQCAGQPEHPEKRGNLGTVCSPGDLPFLCPQSALLRHCRMAGGSRRSLAGTLPLSSQDHQFLQSEILWWEAYCHDRRP